MAGNTQGQRRLSLGSELQMFDATPAASLVCEQIKSKSVAYQMTIEDDTILVDTSGASVTVTLPRAVDAYKGKVYSVVKLVAANTMTLEGYGSEAIEGGTNLTATGRWERLSVISDGTRWLRAFPSQGGGGTAAPSTTIGDGSGSPSLTLNKADGGTSKVSLTVGAVERGRLGLTTGEVLELVQNDAAGAEVGKLSFNATTGAATFTKGVTITTGGLVISAGGLDNTGNLFLRGLSNYADDAAAAAGGIAIGQAYRNASVVMVRVA